MTQDEIMEMAKEAGFFIIANSPDLFPKLVAFANLVAAKEREALAQTQEPVACVQDLDEVKRKHLVYEKGMDWKDPLYTTPPQRTWVGLTAEQMLECNMDGDFMVDRETAKLNVQAKLKELNT